MGILDLSQIIDELPNILMYICPGYITLWIHNSVIARKLEQNNYMIIKSIVLSYIYVMVARWVYFINPLIIVSIIAVICGVAFRKIITSKCFNKIVQFFGIDSTPHNDIIDRLRDISGTWFRVYLDAQSIMYEGYLRYDRMDVEDERVIALSGYIKYKILDKAIITEESGTFTELEIIEDFTCDNSKWIALKYDLVTRIEVVYNEPK